ncbi:2Fe-2S iron-sulfur cluster-binding protein [Gordonia terrae]|uniref:2Fe-2S iron-sulfur cluster-binding protein n=1 Tax=Gordonia terrae TaxID=2055 RepID=UPI003F6C2BB4
MESRVSLSVNGVHHDVRVDTRTTLLDGLRDRLGIYSPKKGCDHGQCGSCTVLVDGRRVISCLSFAVSYEGAEIVTAEGLRGDEAPSGDDDAGDDLHALHRAFIEQDAFQCGYCTPGQVCSAAGMLDEAQRGDPSHVTEELDPEADIDPLSDEEIRERMSGNLCRCAAYPNILAAIRQVAGR